MTKRSVKVAIASDLHLAPFSSKYRREFLDPSLEPDIIILAGDIAEGRYSIQTIHETADRFPSAEIVFVAGNHEFYGGCHSEVLRELRAAFECCSRIHFLENARIEVEGLTILGCTLWSDFSILGEPELAMREAEKYIADFTYIKTDNHNRFTPSDAARLFQGSYEFLDDNLANSNPATTIVVTHFPPGMSSHNPDFHVAPLSAYFQANTEYLIDTYQPALWVYGHNHHSTDFYIDATRVVSNQLGYPSEPKFITGFDPLKIIEFELN